MGFVSALTRIEGKKNEEFKRLEALRGRFTQELLRVIPDIVINGDMKNRLPNNIHISVPFIEGESMVLMLDAAGVQVSTGSACSASDLQVSHVLTAIKQDMNLMHGSLRLTMGESTTQEDCDYVLFVLSSIITRLRSMSPLLTVL